MQLVARYTQIGAQYGCSISIPEQFRPKDTGSSNKTVILCIDNSGSMGGNPLTNAKSAVLDLITELRKYGMYKVVVIFWNSYPTAYDIENESEKDIENRFQQVRATGGTSFDECLQWILKNSKKDQPYSILFFTDGQGYFNSAKALPFKELNCEFHCIGFTPSHDAKILNAISNCGSNPGTFQYASDIPKMKECVSNVLGVLLENTLQCRVVTSKETLQATIDGFGACKFLVSEEDIQHGELKVLLNEEPLMFKLEKSETSDPESSEILLWSLRKALEAESEGIFVENPTKSRVSDCLKNIDTIHAQIQDVVKFAYTLKKPFRSEVIGKCMELTALVDALRARAAIAISGRLTNAQIAEWKDLASRPRLTNRRANKELDKRTIENAELLNESMKEIEKVVEAMDFSNIKIPDDVMENCVCMNTLNNPKDALKDGDCICLTLQVRRSEAAIFDANQLSIDGIGLSWMTCDTFFETSAIAKKYAEADSVMNEASLKPGAPVAEVKKKGSNSDFQGGFDKSKVGSLVKGVAAENINAIMPLWLSDDHWKVAKIKMKPVLGYVCTLDVTGYANSQQLIVPFLVLYKSIIDSKQHDDDNRKFVRRLIKETCEAIYRPRLKFREETIKKFEEFMKSPLGRHTEAIPAFSTFIMHLYMALEHGDIDHETFVSNLDLFYCYVTEEMIRRNLRNADELPDAISLYQIDRTKMIDSVVDIWDNETSSKSGGGDSHAVFLFEQALAAKNAGIATQQVKSPTEETTLTKTESDTSAAVTAPMATSTLPEPIFDSSQFIVGNTARRFMKQSLDVSLFPMFHALEFISGRKISNKFKELDLIVKLAMVIQCWEQRKHADRIQAVDSGSYVDFLQPDGLEKAVEFIKARWTQTILTERQKAIAAIIQMRSSSDANKAAAEFAKTLNVHEAAGLIMTKAQYLGRESFGAFFTQFQTTRYNHPNLRGDKKLLVEKLKMFILGEYEGITLRLDFGRWKPSKRNMYRIWVTYRRIMTREQFAEIFPDNIEQIDKLYYLEKTTNIQLEPPLIVS